MGGGRGGRWRMSFLQPSPLTSLAVALVVAEGIGFHVD